MSVQTWAWIVAVCLIAGLLAADVAVHRLGKFDGMRPAVIESAVWISPSPRGSHRAGL